MNEIVSTIIDELKQLFGNNTINLLVFFAFLFLVIWLYKEFRNKMVEDERVRKEKINTILVELTDLEFELDEFIRNKSNFEKLKEKLIKVYPHLSYQLSEKVNKFTPDVEEAFIKEFKKELNVEKGLIKLNQNDEISHINERSLMKLWEYHYKTKFEPIVNPLILAIFSVLFVVIILMVWLGYTQADSNAKKYFLTQEIANIIIFIPFALGFLDSIKNKKLVKKWSSYIYLISFFTISILSFMFFEKVPFLSTLVGLFYLLSIYFIPKIIDKNN
ncbi:hypothetical protein E2K98_12655 [Bacillus salipaludis]|uniref:Uncharacterized protein n=1 Tax=Bacillus salipaludis TaxID=2547811 RepID=A0A4R5VSH9_9BACI|nr:hypothetical protein [Bacillus salipaludis]TDK61734.1 hypothetical protein E2K98_12655 [Bacillus salipaludis]